MEPLGRNVAMKELLRKAALEEAEPTFFQRLRMWWALFIAQGDNT